MWRNVLALRQISQRTISTASRRQFPNRVAENQKVFQEDNGLPVHLKGGTKDSLLYTTTAGLAVFEFHMAFSQTKYWGLNTPSAFMYGVREEHSFIYSAKKNNVCSLLSEYLFNAQEAELIPFEDASATNISLSSSHVTVVAAYYKQLA